MAKIVIVAIIVIQVVMVFILVTAVIIITIDMQRGPQQLACPNPCCDLRILKSCIVYFGLCLALQPLQL